MHDIRAALENHARVLEEIIKRQDEQEQALMLLGEVVLEDEYYTVEDYAARTKQLLKKSELKMLKSIAFHLSKKKEVEVDGDEYRIDILQEAFRWTF
jgi:hypothetical protein